MGEWVQHREHGVGEVLEVDGRHRFVRFRSDARWVSSKFVPIGAGSLEVRAFKDLPAFLTWIDEEPADAATALLRPHPDGLDAQQVAGKLKRLGVPDDVAARWWSEIAEPLLRARDDVVVSGKVKERFAIRQGPDPDATLAEASGALVGLSKKRVTADQRSRLVRAVEAADRTMALPPALRGAARALGVHLSDAPLLAEVDPAALPADVVRRLLERDNPRFLTRAVVDARGSDVARAAAERCQVQVTQVERAGHAAAVCGEAETEITTASSDSIGAVAERLTNRIHRLRLLVPDGPTAALVAAVLQLLAAIDRIGSQDKQLARLRGATEGTIAAAPETFEAFTTALRLDSVAALSDEVLARAWVNQPLEPHSVRLAWLRALARVRTGVLASHVAWSGVDVAGLQRVASVEEIGSWLSGTQSGRQRRSLIAESILARLDRTTLGQLIAGDNDVLETLPPDRLRVALDRLVEREPSLHVIAEGFAANQLDALGATHAAEIERVEAEHAERLRAATERTAAAEVRADRQTAEAELARRLMQSASSDGAAAVELRQARIDSLRVAADILAEVERAKSRVPGLDELASRLAAIAETSGLRHDAELGEVVLFDHQRHRPVVDDDIADGTEVTVVEPAWLASADGVTAIRYGLVRKQVPSNEGTDGGRNGARGGLRNDDDTRGPTEGCDQRGDPTGAGGPVDADARRRRP